MLQVKFFYFDLHKPKGSKADQIEQAINDWLKEAGHITVITEDSIPVEVTQGHIIWNIWYEDYNDPDETDDTASSLAAVNSLALNE